MNDMNIKKTMEEIKTSKREGVDHLETISSNPQAKFTETTATIDGGARRLESIFREETQDIKDQPVEICRLIETASGMSNRG